MALCINLSLLVEPATKRLAAAGALAEPRRNGIAPRAVCGAGSDARTPHGGTRREEHGHGGVLPDPFAGARCGR